MKEMEEMKEDEEGRDDEMEENFSSTITKEGQEKATLIQHSRS